MSLSKTGKPDFSSPGSRPLRIRWAAMRLWRSVALPFAAISALGVQSVSSPATCSDNEVRTAATSASFDPK